jgi:hypothetical protein
MKEFYRVCALLFLRCDPDRQDIYQLALEQSDLMQCRKRIFDDRFVFNANRTLDEMAAVNLLCSGSCAKGCQGYPHVDVSVLKVLDTMPGVVGTNCRADELINKSGATAKVIPAINEILVFYSDSDLR